MGLGPGEVGTMVARYGPGEVEQRHLIVYSWWAIPLEVAPWGFINLCGEGGV